MATFRVSGRGHIHNPSTVFQREAIGRSSLERGKSGFGLSIPDVDRDVQEASSVRKKRRQYMNFVGGRRRELRRFAAGGGNLEHAFLERAEDDRPVGIPRASTDRPAAHVVGQG